ncbi:hypothetical protein [Coleofasciculus sp. F4-SAH-05]|uniref:hypothetical protein n=1 Tax=Coleofasciculus sp. F4-SAH-05 TaxID=3069525 RepID=UPI0032FB177A
MSSCDRVVILFISGTLALTTWACSRLESSGRLEDSSQPIVTSTTPSVSPQPSTPPESAETQTQPTADEFYRDRGLGRS